MSWLDYLNPITGLVKLLVSPITENLAHKRKLKKIERVTELRIQTNKANSLIKEKEKDQDAEISLDYISIQQRGWKDEYLLLLSTLPLVILFISPLVDLMLFKKFEAGALTLAVQDSFTALQATPDYYWIVLAILYIDTFGLRRMLKTFLTQYRGKPNANNV